MTLSRIGKVFFLVVFCLMPPLGTASGSAATSNNQGNVNSEELKQDYRAFLQQLKQLNSQYKQVTGEITKVMKEEGVPTWDAGNEAKELDKLFPQEPTVLSPELGVTIKESANEMIISMDLPGIKKDTIKLTMKDNKKLTVFAHKKDDTVIKTIEKTVELPSFGEPKGTRATYEDGVLTLKIQKINSNEVIIPVK